MSRSRSRNTDGSVEVGAGFNQCPDLTLNVSPSQGEPSQPFTVEGAASDPDNDAVTVSLQADSGTFSTANQLPATFMCGKPGLVTITATASDGSCQTMKSVMIFCLGTHGGDGGGTGPDASHQDAGASSGDGSADGGGMVVTNICPTESPKGSTDCTDCTNTTARWRPTRWEPMAAAACRASPIKCCASQPQSASATTIARSAATPIAASAAGRGSSCYSVPGAANGPCVAAVVAAAKKTICRSSRRSSRARPLRSAGLSTCSIAADRSAQRECGVP